MALYDDKTDKVNTLSYEPQQIEIRGEGISHRQPYKCPVCDGNGLVPGGFYEKVGNVWVTDHTAETCRSCNGSGIVWG